MATIRPLHDKVLIRPHPRQTQTESGLHLSEHWKPEEMGSVMAVGPKCVMVKVLDDVVFSWAAGQELLINDGEDRLLLMRETDISAVLERS